MKILIEIDEEELRADWAEMADKKPGDADSDDLYNQINGYFDNFPFCVQILETSP